MKSPKILVAGIGNIFFGDDAFGVEVARRLMSRNSLPVGVRVVDFGIRGIDLVYALLEDYDLVVLIDALSRGEKPGTLYLLEPDGEQVEKDGNFATGMEMHSMDPVKVLQQARMMGGTVRCLRIVGCEPASLGTEEEPTMGLSPAVESALEEAVRMVESLVRANAAEALDQQPATP